MPSPQYQRNQASVRALKHHGLFDFCFRRGLPSKRVLRHKTLEKKSSFPLTDARSVTEGLLRNFGLLAKSGMGVSPVSAWNRKDGRDARPTLSAPLGNLKSSYPLTDARSVREGLPRSLPRLRKRFCLQLRCQKTGLRRAQSGRRDACSTLLAREPHFHQRLI